MAQKRSDIANTALLLADLQNDFLHPLGAYGRAGQTAPEIAALPARIKPLAEAVRGRGGLVIATQFTLVPGRGGAPLISPHIKKDPTVPGARRFRAGVLGPGDDR